MDFRKSILETLRTAEVALLELVGQAAAQCDYSGIDLARGAAEQVRVVQRRISGDGDRVERALLEHDQNRVARVTERQSVSKRKKGYPRFKIEDSMLTKIGWSKKKKSEYTQRVPREIFDLVVDALVAVQRHADGGPVPTESVHVNLERGGHALPSYQVYSILGFLRARGVIRPSARGEYVIPPDVAETARSEWLRAEQITE